MDAGLFFDRRQQGFDLAQVQRGGTGKRTPAKGSVCYQGQRPLPASLLIQHFGVNLLASNHCLQVDAFQSIIKSQVKRAGQVEKNRLSRTRRAGVVRNVAADRRVRKIALLLVLDRVSGRVNK